jgi:hypothetical protein
MLALAIEAGIPLVGIRGNDTIHLDAVLKAVTGLTALEAPDLSSLECHAELGRQPASLFWSLTTPPFLEDLYRLLMEQNRHLVILNPEPHPLIFPAGELLPPKKLVRKMLAEVVEEAQLDPLVDGFAGLSLKDCWAISRLAMAKYRELTPKAVLHTRASLMARIPGLQPMGEELGVYLPFQPLQEWLELNAPFFLDPGDPRLVPRGLLLHGAPGTGKSTAAKYLAGALGVPLFRLDLGSLLSGCVGESEKALARALAALDAASSAVLLIDEADKLFGGGTDQGVMSRLLSQLLWWLAEHRSRVLTVMTTGSLKDLPKELYRERRIDQVFEMPKLNPEEAGALGSEVLASLGKDVPPGTVKLRLMVTLHPGETRYSHAEVTQAMYDAVKQGVW